MDDLGGRRCFRNAGQIYFGDVVESEDGSCMRHGQGRQIITATTVAGDNVMWGRYEGAWKDDRMTGTGTYRWDGTVYQGVFLDGRPHGRGRLTWPEGSYYDGAWRDGEMTGQGSFYSAYEGYTSHGKFVRNCVKRHDGNWVNLVEKREADWAACLRIGASPPPMNGGPAPASEHVLPVTFCSSEELADKVAETLSARRRVPLILASDSCPKAGGSNGSMAPLWCLEEAGKHGCSPTTTVHLLYAAAEKRRKRDHAQIFRDAIREALLTYRPFCLVFPDDGDGEENPQDDSGSLPAALGLDEFLEPCSLPADLFDLQHFHTLLGFERFLPPEKQGARAALPAAKVAAGVAEAAQGDAAPAEDGGAGETTEEAASAAHPPVLAPLLLYLLRFALVSLRRVRSGADAEEVRQHVIRRFAESVPLHRTSVIVVR